MRYNFVNKEGNGKLILFKKETYLEKFCIENLENKSFYTIAWNIGKSQKIKIDEVDYKFPENCILPLTQDQSFVFEKSEDIIAWQFNRDFYCIFDHDHEVGCIGFIFYGPSPTMFLVIDQENSDKILASVKSFEEEFTSNDSIKGEMLRSLLLWLIIKITRIAKLQYWQPGIEAEKKLDLLRKYNVLVEMHFKKEHQVQFYAGILNKSPKTISNVFKLISKRSPLQIIHERLILEAKRLFYYTDKSVKEISNELGFEEPAHFSKFFKKHTSKNPSNYRDKTEIEPLGIIAN